MLKKILDSEPFTSHSNLGSSTKVREKRAVKSKIEKDLVTANTANHDYYYYFLWYIFGKYCVQFLILFNLNHV